MVNVYDEGGGGEMHTYPREFNLDDSNLFLNTVYENDNYKILNGICGDICLVFCSGNGVYFPNELEVFKETIICYDRYEWGHVATEMIYYVKKIIFIRDVRKNFYVTGINHEIDCIDKLIGFLKDECRGYKTITIGNSAGGYLASIIGAQLHAQAVFNFSGQWNLYGYREVVKDYYYLNKFANSEIHNKYYDISQLVKDSGIPIFYFYSQKNEQDVKQMAYIHNISNIYFFAFNSNKHGQGLSKTESYIKLFMSDCEMLKKLSNSYRGISLEPDKMDCLINKIFSCEAVFSDIPRVERDEMKKILDKQLLSDKHLALVKMMNQWLRVKQVGKNLASNFEKNGYNKIAIYGMSYAGEALVRELEGTKVKVAYGIDKNANSISADIDVVTIEDDLTEVDVVVVTAICSFNEIKDKLMSKMPCPVISLEDILYEM